jgi:hypothetical protein
MFKYPGTWWVYSEKDPRWNRLGHVDSLVMGSRPKEAQEAIEALKKKYGKVPPDLTVQYDKD